MGAGRFVSCSRGPYVGRQPQMMAVPSSTVLQTMPRERDGTKAAVSGCWSKGYWNVPVIGSFGL